jgi:hypothetical protein
MPLCYPTKVTKTMKFPWEISSVSIVPFIVLGAASASVSDDFTASSIHESFKFYTCQEMYTMVNSDYIQCIMSQQFYEMTEYLIKVNIQLQRRNT